MGQGNYRLREGDTLEVWRLGPLVRSLKHLIDTINELHTCGISFWGLNKNIGTTTPGAGLVSRTFVALEFERGLIRERTNTGLAAGRARGRKGGRSR